MYYRRTRFKACANVRRTRARNTNDTGVCSTDAGGARRTKRFRRGPEEDDDGSDGVEARQSGRFNAGRFRRAESDGKVEQIRNGLRRTDVAAVIAEPQVIVDETFVPA